jgi:murein DD-endopeptidase MepM/ murein hydrolase activator NlpD
MRWAGRRRTQVVVAFLAIAAIVAVLVARLGRVSRRGRQQTVIWSWPPTSPDNSAGGVSTRPSPANNASPVVPSPTPGESPAGASPALSPSPAPQVPEGTAPNNLIIPVTGVRPDQLRDTFTESRSEGRVHDAIDIIAPLGTPVLAAADGPIVKLFHSEPGGTTIYQLSTDNKFVYYYAHLDRYADGLTEGHFAKQGETIAYVGDTGNAGPGNYHLHFSIAIISDPKHYWQGVNINPYPLLKR